MRRTGIGQTSTNFDLQTILGFESIFAYGLFRKSILFLRMMKLRANFNRQKELSAIISSTEGD
jgi:hypothetical protein